MSDDEIKLSLRIHNLTYFYVQYIWHLFEPHETMYTWELKYSILHVPNKMFIKCIDCLFVTEEVYVPANVSTYNVLRMSIFVKFTTLLLNDVYSVIDVYRCMIILSCLWTTWHTNAIAWNWLILYRTEGCLVHTDYRTLSVRRKSWKKLTEWQRHIWTYKPYGLRDDIYTLSALFL